MKLSFKSQIRRPKPEPSPKVEVRRPKKVRHPNPETGVRCQPRSVARPRPPAPSAPCPAAIAARGLRTSDFGLRRPLHQAFTLIELLLVLVILGVLAAIVVPKFTGRTEQARITAAQTQITTFGTALDAFEVDNGYYPKGRGGLEDLVVQPRDALNWKGPYLRSTTIPLDPWGNPYLYECPGKHNPSGYDLMSMGPDGREGTEDDITNWQQAGQRSR